MLTPRLEAAFDRIDDFIAVQLGGPGVMTVGAVELLQESLGVNEAQRAVVRDRVAALSARGHNASAGSVLLGVLVGIFASELPAPRNSDA
jgi:hypothetical protein